VFSASAVLDAIASELTAIKAADELTWSDMARVLGKSPDQAAKYADGTAEMGVVAFAAAKREWNGRFTGAVDRLCVDSRPSGDTDRSRQSMVLKAALALSIALEDDGEIDAGEVRQNRACLEGARDAIDQLLRKLSPKQVRA
jgi:DNA-binding IclR family transcriptional regulator